MTRRCNTQTGAVLIAGLMMLLVLTLIGVATMNSSALTEKLTGNLRDSATAFQSSESALLDAEAWLRMQVKKPEAVSTCLSSPCDVWAYGVQQNIEKNSDSWWQVNTRNFSSTLYGSATLPEYMIEEEMFVPTELSPEALARGKGYQFYKVTAKGTGGTSQSKVFVESIYAVTFN